MALARENLYRAGELIMSFIGQLNLFVEMSWFFMCIDVFDVFSFPDKHLTVDIVKFKTRARLSNIWKYLKLCAGFWLTLKWVTEWAWRIQWNTTQSVVKEPSVVLSILSDVFECLVILAVLGDEVLEQFKCRKV